MFHTTINKGADACAFPIGEMALRAFVSEHDEALGCAAVLLADRLGARLINAIRDGFGQPGPLPRRVHRLLVDLRGMLSLDHTHDQDCDDSPFIQMLDPEDPIVHELCLLADGLDEALRGAGVTPASNEQTA
ncbi:MAG: hypothetical protein ABNH38_18670 [Tateyamaria sp.]|uniref:hypothetical protein n=1 Tax=Tateyamaria sp. TaxID=1929288 RepID=UPI0032DCCE72